MLIISWFFVFETPKMKAEYMFSLLLKKQFFRVQHTHWTRKNSNFQKYSQFWWFFDCFWKNTPVDRNSKTWKTGFSRIFGPEGPYPPRKSIQCMYVSAVGITLCSENGPLKCAESPGGRLLFANCCIKLQSNVTFSLFNIFSIRLQRRKAETVFFRLTLAVYCYNE